MVSKEDRPAQGHVPPAADTASSSEASDDDVFDVDDTLRRIPGGIRVLQKMAPVMIAECSAHLDQIHAGIQGRDAKQVWHSAHTIKGSVAMFGAKRAVAAAQKLEQMGRDNKLTGAEAVLETLVQEVNRLCESIKSLTS